MLWWGIRLWVSRCLWQLSILDFRNLIPPLLYSDMFTPLSHILSSQPSAQPHQMHFTYINPQVRFWQPALIQFNSILPCGRGHWLCDHCTLEWVIKASQALFSPLPGTLAPSQLLISPLLGVITPCTGTPIYTAMSEEPTP